MTSVHDFATATRPATPSAAAQEPAPALPPGLDRNTLDALTHGRLGDPFAVLGPHRLETAEGERPHRVVRAFHPGARRVQAIDPRGQVMAELAPVGRTGLFHGRLPNDAPDADGHPGAYRLRVIWPAGAGHEAVQEAEDPYAFGLLLGDLDLHLIAEGRHWELARCLGAQAMRQDDVAGVRFAVWAPNARRVSVVGDFNQWDGRRHPMRLRHGTGVWELFVPAGLGAGPGSRYKFELVGADGHLLVKADPVARRTEAPPATASVVADPLPFRWSDAAWMETRAARQRPDAPIAIYEVHAGSWLRDVEDGGRSLDWDALGERLIPYVAGLGFTHVELLPVAEHPFGGSWGYQPLGLFAPSARFGPPEAFARFVERCHQAALGVVVDWVPAHFPSDPHGLARFDGTALYEHADPREGFHQDWNTLIYNFGRHEVRGFLIASALEWLEHFHIDGLRVDAVASMLYRDYSRPADAWVPNRYGGRENLEAVAFLQQMNAVVHARCPGAITIAEESTAWPGVTAAVEVNGLGFDYKWNMGWMHDTLHYMQRDPIYRQHHHDGLTFGLVYAFSERFILPLSHDEVVHGKGSLLGKMPGDDWQRLANLRAYLAFMWTHPGKKLLFMGGEFGQLGEWNHDAAPEWHLLDDPRHRGVQRLVHDLNALYRSEPALHARDCAPEGFSWVIGDDRANSVFAYLRLDTAGTPMLIVANMTPVPRDGYRIGVPDVDGAVRWREMLNTDSAVYGGTNLGNGGVVDVEDVESHGWRRSVVVRLPPLAVVVLKI
ncbi:1,4-alpha-glucan branching protein GlgB [Ralstonia pseudosolanacearum]|uniref:1,4-alpha-glucan branching protein GlgB n=1 Tax=Ralstonia pseudosolanacearum TaxID=1310165 RepID=UPI0026757C8B|nr:1,4-alpha-glucan branching protein GlgB [Ralstonia pseudosolanacearum]MDO3528397.1 1,4-alpha-glucan branching protein GlgB [Ralstonia pseudosolanacearum]